MKHSSIVRAAAVPFLALSLAFCSQAASAPQPPAPAPARAPTGPKPTLLVFITVDQMRPDYFDRFKSQLSSGLVRLFGNGAFFTNAHQDHAITETAPGHASLMSGRFPRSTGITRNLAGVNSRDWPLIGAKDLGAAPFRFRGTTVTDWLLAVDPAARIFSVSSKDRGAILPIGRSKQNVYWFADNGTFTTSTWYRDTLPTWVNDFNALRLPHRYAGQQWATLRPDADYPERDSVPYEGFGRNFTFPHQFPADSTATATRMRYTPMIDELTLRFAMRGLRQLDLGARPGGTDILAVSLSGTDYVGHFYGPESKEQHDQILRLDRVLGAFLDTLYTLRDSNNVVIALSADHGGGFIPELHGKLRVDIGGAIDVAIAAVKAAGGDTTALDTESGAFFVDPAKLGPKMTVDRITGIFIKAAKTVPGVLRVDRFADFAKRDLEKDKIARRWVQMFPDDMLPEAVVTLREGDIFNYPIVATHGSPHDYDSNVPIIFYGAPFKPGRYPGFVRTVDIAPTLAAILQIKPTERLDGRALSEAFR